MEPWNLAMYTDTNRAHICCDVCSLLGTIPFILFLGQNCEGWFCKFYWLYMYYWLYVSSAISIWFLQVWYATESGNLEVTYTHNEEHVCILLFTFPLDNWFIILWCLKCWYLIIVWNQSLVLLSMIQLYSSWAELKFSQDVCGLENIKNVAQVSDHEKYSG